MAKLAAPKIIFWDIETSPNTCYSWRIGSKITLNHHNITEEKKIICICYKYAGSKKLYSITWDKNQDDRAMLIKFSKVLSKIDIAVAHNGDSFDLKWVKTRLLIHKLPPITGVQTIDTLKLARQNFNLNSNSLDYICKILKLPLKKSVGYDVWVDTMRGKRKALSTLVDYCKQDVVVLEKCFNELAPRAERMPVHMGILVGKGRDACPSCGDTHTIKWGIRTTRAGKYQRYLCNGCGHCFHNTRVMKEI